MPKQKTRKGVAKRFNITKSGRVKRAKAFKSHILTKKRKKRKRSLRKGSYVTSSDAKSIKKLLPGK